MTWHVAQLDQRNAFVRAYTQGPAPLVHVGSERKPWLLGGGVIAGAIAIPALGYAVAGKWGLGIGLGIDALGAGALWFGGFLGGGNP